MAMKSPLLKDLVGTDGLEALEKAIVKRGGPSIVEPLEFYLPLIVAPRAILSWLVENIKPMKAGDYKDIPFPGKPEITIHIEKQDVDLYRAEFIKAGRIIHGFEKQTLPAISAHLMTAGEMYDDFAAPKEIKEAPAPEIKPIEVKPAEEIVRPNSSQDVVRSIMRLNEMHVESSDPEHLKWAASHANIRDLTSVVGKLVDALVSRHHTSQQVGEVLDKVSVSEIKGEDQKVQDSNTPKDIDQAQRKAAKEPKTEDQEYKQDALAHIDTMRETMRDKQEEPNKAPESQEVKSGKEAQAGQIKKEEKICSPRQTLRGLKPRMPEPLKKPVNKTMEMPGLGGAANGSAGTENEPGHGSPNMVGSVSPKEKKVEVKSSSVQVPTSLKPNARDLLRKLKPNTVKAEMPSGAGMAKQPSMPQQPKPPVQASKNPAGAAAKQAQASAKGLSTAPKAPQGPKMPSAPKSPAATPKVPGIAKSEPKYMVTEAELYSKCSDCGQAEFSPDSHGTPQFNPCACFAVMKNSNKQQQFVTVLKKSDGGFNLIFNPKSEQDVVKTFLLTLKANLLMKRRWGVE